MWRIGSFLMAIVLLGGCALPGVYSGMTAKEIDAMAKMKDASVFCVEGAGPPMTGSGKMVMVSVDKGITAVAEVKDGCGKVIIDSRPQPSISPAPVTPPR